MKDLDNVLCFARHIIERDGADAKGEDVYKVQAALASIIRAKNEVQELYKIKQAVHKITQMMLGYESQWAGVGWMGERFCTSCGNSAGSHANNCEYNALLKELISYEQKT